MGCQDRHEDFHKRSCVRTRLPHVTFWIHILFPAAKRSKLTHAPPHSAKLLTRRAPSEFSTTYTSPSPSMTVVRYSVVLSMMIWLRAATGVAICGCRLGWGVLRRMHLIN